MAAIQIRNLSRLISNLSGCNYGGGPCGSQLAKLSLTEAEYVPLRYGSRKIAIVVNHWDSIRESPSYANQGDDMLISLTVSDAIAFTIHCVHQAI